MQYTEILTISTQISAGNNFVAISQTNQHYNRKKITVHLNSARLVMLTVVSPI